VRLASIHLYPMKAARAVDLDEACVEPWGLAGDRRWLLVDGNGRFISQREEPSLARVVVRPGAGSISVSADGVPGPTIAPPPANVAYTTYWSNDGTSSGGSEPSAAVSVNVNSGLFTMALGDPTLRLAYWLDDERGYINVRGKPFDIPPDTPTPADPDPDSPRFRL